MIYASIMALISSTDNEELEFDVTEEDLLSDSDLDEEIIFEDSVEEQTPSYTVVQEFNDQSHSRLGGSSAVDAQNPVSNISTAPALGYTYMVPSSVSLLSRLQSDCEVIKEKLEKSSQENKKEISQSLMSSELRNEDVIFGELVGSMLAKIEDEGKKKAIKRNILNMFFD